MRGQLRVLLLSLTGCAHWGTTNLGSVPAPPPVASTYLAPARPPTPSQTVVPATTEPPPAGSTVIAISRVPCSGEPERCLRALLDEAHRLGGDGVFGIHRESVPRGGTAWVGSVAFSGRPTVPLPPSGRETALRWQPQAGEPQDVFLERRERDLVLQGPPSPWTVESWRLLCKLPCTADLDDKSSYRLVAPELQDEPPLRLAPPQGSRMRVVARPGRRAYGRFWGGLAMTLAGGAVTGGTTAYYLANQRSSSGLAELTVGLVMLPCLLLGLEEMLLGPVNHVELA